MLLETIEQAPKETRPPPKRGQFETSGSLSTRDIAGASPTALIPCSTLYKPIDRSLTTDDIEGTKPLVNRMMRTNRHTNPLQPSYTLPQVAYAPAPAPKFIRNPLDVHDIDGATPIREKAFVRENTEPGTIGSHYVRERQKLEKAKEAAQREKEHRSTKTRIASSSTSNPSPKMLDLQTQQRPKVPPLRRLLQ